MTISRTHMMSPVPCIALIAVLIAASLGSSSCGGPGYANFPSNHVSASSASEPVSGSFGNTIASTSTNGGSVAVSISSSYVGTVGQNANSFGVPITITVDGASASSDQLIFTLQNLPGTGTSGGSGTGVGIVAGSGTGGGVGAGGGFGELGDAGSITKTTITGGAGTTLNLSYYTANTVITVPVPTNGAHTIGVTFGPLPSFDGTLPSITPLQVTIQATRNG
jgi:hypothetical protein